MTHKGCRIRSRRIARALRCHKFGRPLSDASRCSTPRYRNSCILLLPPWWEANTQKCRSCTFIAPAWESWAAVNYDSLMSYSGGVRRREFNSLFSRRTNDIADSLSWPVFSPLQILFSRASLLSRQHLEAATKSGSSRWQKPLGFQQANLLQSCHWPEGTSSFSQWLWYRKI